MLRACGRALFSEVAAIYKAGVADFEYPGADAQHWDACRELGLHVAGTGPRQFKACMRAKKSPGIFASHYKWGDLLDLGCYFYVCMLAKSRGFSSAAEVLKLAYERAIFEVRGRQHEWDVEESFHDFCVSNKRGFRFYPRMEFACITSLFSVSFWEAIHELRRGAKHRELEEGLARVAEGLLVPEILSTMLFVALLERIHHPRPNYQGVATLYSMVFENMLDLTLQ